LAFIRVWSMALVLRRLPQEVWRWGLCGFGPLAPLPLLFASLHPPFGAPVAWWGAAVLVEMAVPLAIHALVPDSVPPNISEGSAVAAHGRAQELVVIGATAVMFSGFAAADAG